MSSVDLFCDKPKSNFGTILQYIISFFESPCRSGKLRNLVHNRRVSNGTVALTRVNQEGRSRPGRRSVGTDVMTLRQSSKRSGDPP